MTLQLSGSGTIVGLADSGATTFTVNYSGGGTHAFAWEAHTSTSYRG